jgi:hypothetical protein
LLLLFGPHQVKNKRMVFWLIPPFFQLSFPFEQLVHTTF